MKRPQRHPYRPWLPAVSDVEFPDSNRPGAPLVMFLRTYKNDKSMRAYQENTCCTCGSVHFLTYEIFKDVPKNEWWLVKRAWPLGVKKGK